MVDYTTRERLLGDLKPAGWVLWWTGCVRLYRNGERTLGMVFRWWHPISWIVWLVMLLVCGVIGEKVNEQVPFRVSKWWRERYDEIEWF